VQRCKRNKTQPNAGDAKPAPFAHILCAVDGSRGSDVAVEQAITLAGPAGVTFIAVTDVRGSGAMQMATLGPQRAEGALARAAAAAKAAGAGSSIVLRRALDVRDALLAHARHYDLLVLGTHGAKRRAGVLLGDLAATALHRSPVPVLLARPAPYGTTFPTALLVATDGTAPTLAAAGAAAQIALRHGARVTLLHAGFGTRDIRHGLVEQQALLAERTGVEPPILELPGSAPEVIVETAHSLPASLIVTGSRMLTGIRSIGSVSERVGQMAPCSVLVLRG
jgi:nucleotide-binding universal stress UspA family protein